MTETKPCEAWAAVNREGCLVSVSGRYLIYYSRQQANKTLSNLDLDMGYTAQPVTITAPTDGAGALLRECLGWLRQSYAPEIDDLRKRIDAHLSGKDRT